MHVLPVPTGISSGNRKYFIEWCISNLVHHSCTDYYPLSQLQDVPFNSYAPVGETSVPYKTFHLLINKIADKVSWWYWPTYATGYSRNRCYRNPARFWYMGKEFIALRFGNDLGSSNFKAIDIARRRMYSAQSVEVLRKILYLLTEGLRAAPKFACGDEPRQVKNLAKQLLRRKICITSSVSTMMVTQSSGVLRR